MKLSIHFQYPHKTIRLAQLVWLVLFLGLGAVLLYAQPSLHVVYQLALMLSIIPLALFNLKQLKRNYARYQAIYWDSQQWFLLMDKDKKAIELTDNTRAFAWWILLEFCYADEKTLLKHQLLLPRDMLREDDFRDLSRSLRFLSVESEN